MKEKTDRTPRATRSALSSPWSFFALVFCWTWFFWLSAAVLKISIHTAMGSTLLLLGLLGPMGCGIALTYLTRGKEGRREYWSRVVDPKRIRAQWYPVIILFAPVLMAMAVLLDMASGSNGTVAQVAKRTAPFLSAPGTIIPFALGVFICGPFPEELGWRGYVLDRLQSRWNALGSSLILGVVWALWHLPLFFIKDMLHFERGLGSPWFWQFMVTVIPMAIIVTWIFNSTQRSTLAAILFHFMANLTYSLANVTAGTNLYSTLLWIVAAIAVVALWDAGTPTRYAPLR